MSFYYILPVQDEVVAADPQWVTQSYDPLSCPRCHDVLSEHERPFNVTITDQVSGPLAAIRFPIRLGLLRRDCFGFLHGSMSGFLFGSVALSGRRLDNYVSVFASSESRVLIFGDERSRYSSCASCGRPNERMIVGTKWCRAADIRRRLVFSDTGGGALYVASSLLDEMRPALRTQLKLYPIHVRP